MRNLFPRPENEPPDEIALFVVILLFNKRNPTIRSSPGACWMGILTQHMLLIQV
jgi:hypothetical protein